MAPRAYSRRGKYLVVNPFDLPDDELEIVRSWQSAVTGRSYIFRELKKYTVFLASASPPTAYGVVALSQPFEELVGPYWPVLVDATLLSFTDKIIYETALLPAGSV